MRKILRYSYLFACFTVILSNRALAYLDPSVMTYAIQVVAGVAVAAGAVVSVYWRKAKKLLQNRLGIDENANKIIEPDIIEYTDVEYPI